MQDLLQIIPTELVEKILSLINSPQDLRSLSLSARYTYQPVKRHADYRHIRCSLTQGEAVWRILANDRSLAANVRILEIQPQVSIIPLKAMLLPAALSTLPTLDFTMEAESALALALPNLVNLHMFRWASRTPEVGKDVMTTLDRNELGDIGDFRNGEEVWIGLATLKGLRHVEILDERGISRFRFNESPLWLMRGLTSFALTIDWDEKYLHHEQFALSGLAKMLGVGCPALESLEITVDLYKIPRISRIYPKESRGDMFLGPYTWPHLHTLKLYGIIGCNSVNARIFLQNHPRIETLAIGRYFGLDMDEHDRNYTDWDVTPYPLDTLPNLRWLAVWQSTLAHHILSSPTTLPRPFARLSDIFPSEDLITYLTGLPHFTRLDFGQCNPVEVISGITNTALSARLQWLDIGYSQPSYGDEWFSTTDSLIPTLGAFPNLVAFHGIEMIRLDAPFAQNTLIATTLLRTCPKLRRIDFWRRPTQEPHLTDRFNDRLSYIALSRNDDGMVIWKKCKMDEWRDEWLLGIE